MKICSTFSFAIWAPILALLLTSCGTTPVPTSQTTHVSLKYVVAAKETFWKESGVPVIIKRDSGYKGGGGRVTFLLNGKAIAKLQTSERVDLRLPPGDYMFGAVFSTNPFNSAPAERHVQIKPGGITTYRIYFPSGDGTVQIDATSL